MRTPTRRTAMPPWLSLVEVIADLNARFDRLKSELRDAHQEIKRLTTALTQRGVEEDELPGVDLAGLRRRTAFYCHPDRGGDAGVMQDLNSLFDFLEVLQGARLTPSQGPVA